MGLLPRATPSRGTKRGSLQVTVCELDSRPPQVTIWLWQILDERSRAVFVPARRCLQSRLVRAAALSTLAVSSVPVAQHLESSQVLAACDPGRTNDGRTYFAGWIRDVDNETEDGSRANILVRDVFVASPSFGGVTSWTMLIDPPSRWAQIGWLERLDDERSTLIQYHDGGGDLRTFLLLPGEPVGSSPEYKVEWYPATSVTPRAVSFFINGGQVHNDDAGFTPTEAQQAGEIKTLASQMPGGTSEKERFRNANVRVLNEDWQAFAGTPAVVDEDGNDASTYFGAEKISTTELQIWDKFCST